MHRALLRHLLGDLPDDALDHWDRAAAALGPAAAARAAAAERFRGLAGPALDGALRHLGPEAVAATRAAEVGGDHALVGHEVALAELAAVDDAELPAALAASTAAASAALLALRDPGEAGAARLARALPAVAALATPLPPQVEHAALPTGVPTRPLLDRALRALDRRLAGLERGDRARFDPAGVLGEAAFARARATLAGVQAAGLLPAVRLALLHLDVAKGGDADTRAGWVRRIGDLTIHNLASARLFAQAVTHDLPGAPRALVRALVAHHGLAGQALRGEVPPAAFAPTIVELAALAPALAARLAIDPPAALALAVRCLHLVDVVDTAAVRDGLVDDALLAGLEASRDALLAAAAQAGPADAAALAAAMLRDDAARARLGDPGGARTALADRLCRLRSARQRAGEPRADVEAALASLADDEATALAAALAPCQLWYCEAATAALSPAAQLRVLAAACGAARRAGLDPSRPWHAQLRPLVARLAGDEPRPRYRRRLVEAALASAPVAALLSGEPDDRGGVLATVAGALGDDRAVEIDLAETEEAGALVTLLALYETRSSAAFHGTLKALCDLYRLRKDEFDRVANEAQYLATMNAARGDKGRMVELVRPGRIVEVGPGGGVVLDLLEARFPGSEVIGLDVSQEVIEALTTRRTRDGRRWRVVRGDAFSLPDVVGAGTVDSVVYCSVLHEIYSYVERDGRRFGLAPVRELLQATWRALRPGGRIVVRDGVAPPPGTRRLRFVAPDARELFGLFAAQFEGFDVAWRELPDGRVELPAHHAMEFLYTYTWGPESFPYEVREQYGILTYPAYRAALLEWLDGHDGARARLLELPPELASYLQPGYVAGLAGKVELTDEGDRPAALPDSNCLLVVERLPG